MKVAVVSDIHGNYPALQAVWEHMSKTYDDIDLKICAGDIVGAAGFPNETVTFVRENFDVVVHGNHDAWVRKDYPDPEPMTETRRKEIDFVRSELSEENYEWLNKIPEKVTLDNGFVICHAHPHPEEGFSSGFPADNYINKGDWIEFGANEFKGQVLIFGHLHECDIVSLSPYGHDVVFINGGSVGMHPEHAPTYAVYDFEMGEGECHTVSYDWTPVKKKLEEIGFIQYF